jgi:hypothetical protein
MNHDLNINQRWNCAGVALCGLAGWQILAFIARMTEG